MYTNLKLYICFCLHYTDVGKKIRLTVDCITLVVWLLDWIYQLFFLNLILVLILVTSAFHDLDY